MNIQALKSDLAGMAHDAIGQVGETIEHGRDAIEGSAAAIPSAMEGALDGGSRRLRMFARVVGAYASLKTLAMAFDAMPTSTRVLRTFGLQRRPGVMSQALTGAGIFAAGAAVGAGVALLIAPREGRQTRDAIGARIRSLRSDAVHRAHDVESAARDAVHTVEESAVTAAHDVSAAVRGASTAPEEGPAGRGRPRIPGVSHRTPR